MPSGLRKKVLPQAAPSLLSLPKGEKIKERSQFLCRVQKANITASFRKILFPHPAGRAAGWLCVALIVGLCSGCSYFEAYQLPQWNWPAWMMPQSAAPPAPAPAPPRSSRSSYRHRSHVARNHNAPRQPAKVYSDEGAGPPAPAKPASAPSSPSTPPVSLTLAGDSGDRQRAQQLLDDADASLMRARKRHLTSTETLTYERASQLANRARRALQENDCAAASSLASKASSLAAGINER